MRGISPEQLAAYEERLELTASVLASSPMTVREVVAALRGTVAECGEVTVYARIRVLAARGVAVEKKKRRGKISGKNGPRERVFSIIPNGDRRRR